MSFMVQRWLDGFTGGPGSGKGRGILTLWLEFKCVSVFQMGVKYRDRKGEWVRERGKNSCERRNRDFTNWIIYLLMVCLDIQEFSFCHYSLNCLNMVCTQISFTFFNFNYILTQNRNTVVFVIRLICRLKSFWIFS